MERVCGELHTPGHGKLKLQLELIFLLVL